MAFTRLLLPVLAPLALATLAGCGLTTSGEQDPILALDECRIEGIRGDARCGTLDVPENRADPKSRTLTLHFAVLPAKSRGKEPDPVFVIAGGPGQSAIAVARHIAPVFAKLQEKRDIVFLDQRGTGDAVPCAHFDAISAARWSMASEQEDERPSTEGKSQEPG